VQKRTLDRLFIAGGIVLVILVALVLVAPRLLPGDLITHQIIQEVERATGATVTLGEAQLKWRWGWTVTLRDGTIRGTGAALTAATGSGNDLKSYAVDIEELSVAPAMLPLIRKQFVVKSVRLAGPRLMIRWRSGEAEATGYEVRFTDLNLGPDVSVNEGTELSGAGKTPFGELIPADLSFSFTTVTDSLILQGMDYTGLDVRGEFTDKTLEVVALSARRSSGILKGTLVVDFLRNPWGRLEFEAEAELVPAAALLESWAPDIGQRLECELNAKVDGGFDLKDEETIRRTLDMSGFLTAGEGILYAADWLEDVSPYLGQRQDLKDIRFRALRHEFRMTQGRYLVEKLVIGGGDTDWRGEGWVELDGAIALDLDVKLPPGFTPDLGNWSFLARTLRDPEGRINLPLKLSGRAARPTVGVDLGRLQPR